MYIERERETVKVEFHRMVMNIAMFTIVRSIAAVCRDHVKALTSNFPNTMRETC